MLNALLDFTALHLLHVFSVEAGDTARRDLRRKVLAQLAAFAIPRPRYSSVPLVHSARKTAQWKHPVEVEATALEDPHKKVLALLAVFAVTHPHYGNVFLARTVLPAAPWNHDARLDIFVLIKQCKYSALLDTSAILDQQPRLL